MTTEDRKKKTLRRQCEIDFELELSRGASCIASCWTDTSLQHLVEETVLCFLETHGPERFSIFRSLLADRLTARGRPKAAAVVAAHTLPARLCGQTTMRKPSLDISGR